MSKKTILLALAVEAVLCTVAAFLLTPWAILGLGLPAGVLPLLLLPFPPQPPATSDPERRDHSFLTFLLRLTDPSRRKL